MKRTSKMLLICVSGLLFALSAPGCATEQKPDYPPITEPMPDGHYCFKGGDCKSGICEGQGCGPHQPGNCSPKYRICTEDKEVYCVCDGGTKVLLATCPDQRYRYVRGCK